MYNPFTLENKTILVTGASSGIGRQCAVDCSRMGAKVVAVGRNEARLQETLGQMEGTDNAIYSYDLSVIDGIKDFVSRIVAENGRLDGIICAAGIERTAPSRLLKHTDYEEVMRVNTFSVFELVRHATSVKCFNQMGG